MQRTLRSVSYPLTVLLVVETPLAAGGCHQHDVTHRSMKFQHRHDKLGLKNVVSVTLWQHRRFEQAFALRMRMTLPDNDPMMILVTMKLVQYFCVADALVVNNSNFWIWTTTSIS